MKRTQASDWLAGAWRYQQGTDGVLANMCQIVLIRVAPSVTTYTTQELAQQIVTQFTCHKSQTVTNIWMILLSYCWLPIFASMRESSKKGDSFNLLFWYLMRKKLKGSVSRVSWFQSDINGNTFLASYWSVEHILASDWLMRLTMGHCAGWWGSSEFKFQCW